MVKCNLSNTSLSSHYNFFHKIGVYIKLLPTSKNDFIQIFIFHLIYFLYNSTYLKVLRFLYLAHRMLEQCRFMNGKVLKYTYLTCDNDSLTSKSKTCHLPAGDLRKLTSLFIHCLLRQISHRVRDNKLIFASQREFLSHNAVMYQYSKIN